jgi:hypothetical protein
VCSVECVYRSILLVKENMLVNRCDRWPIISDVDKVVFISCDRKDKARHLREPGRGVTRQRLTVGFAPSCGGI